NLVCLLKYVRKTPQGLCTASFEYVRIDFGGSQLTMAQKPGQRLDIHTPGQLIHCKCVPSGMESHTLGDTRPHDPLCQRNVGIGVILQTLEYAITWLSAIL